MPNFISVVAAIAELAHGEKMRTQSLNHSASLFEALGTEAFALPNNTTKETVATFINLLLLILNLLYPLRRTLTSG